MRGGRRKERKEKKEKSGKGVRERGNKEGKWREGRRKEKTSFLRYEVHHKDSFTK